MARRQAQARVDHSEFSARDVSDDFRARDTADELDPMFDETPSGSAEEVEADPVPVPDLKTRGSKAQGLLVNMAPAVRAMFTYVARLARSFTQGAAPDMRPIPPEQRSRGIVLVVQILPDGRRVVFR
jgi:hypothetical protein